MGFIGALIGGIGSILGSAIVGVFGGESAVTTILGFVASGLPDGGGLPNGVHQAALFFGATLSKVNFILPVDVLMSCLVIIMSLKITLYAVHIGLTIVRFIRGIPSPAMFGWGPPGGSVDPSNRSYWGQ